jgi:peptide/nickel transport system ATP-binding protein
MTREGIVHAINGISYTLYDGEVLGILGESGSGKSVSLRALVGLLPPGRTQISGEIHFEGTNLLGLAEQEMNRIRGSRMAMIFQEPMSALDPVFPIGVQIAESIVRHEGASWRAAMRRAKGLLEMVQIPSAERRLHAYPHEMSGGQRQRAMIALALACRPKLLLADEPTTALDVTVQMQIILLLRELQRELGMSVLFVTHDVGVATEISDRLAVMYGGRFVEQGPAVEVIEQPRHPYTSGLLRSTVHGSRRGQRLDAIPGMPPDLRRLSHGCAFAPRCRYVEDHCITTLPELTPVARQHESACLRVVDGSLTLPMPAQPG